jgi:hypothetical protein
MDVTHVGVMSLDNSENDVPRMRRVTAGVATTAGVG